MVYDLKATQFPFSSIAVIIKALNEERYISKAITSALEAVAPVDGVVILADSGSKDRTIDIAYQSDIRIVQLMDSSEKSCGIGAQLGYQFADCEYVYILDGDMEIMPNFLQAAIAELEADPALAGVGGLVEELGEGNYEFERRKALKDGAIIGDVFALDMGGLYRVSAIRDIGHLTNRNLHSYEEKELSIRLCDRGYHLRRLDIPAVRHYGKQNSSASLLFDRVRSYHLDGPGELIRALAGTSMMITSIKPFYKLLAASASIIFLFFTAAIAFWATGPFYISLLVQFSIYFYFLVRLKSVSRSLTAYSNINILACCLMRGLCRRQRDPRAVIAARILK